MRISLIAAMGNNRIIGTRGKLPWNMPADRRYFKGITKGKPVIMGRRTFEAVVEMVGSPLPERFNIVLTRSIKTRGECLDAGCDAVAGSIEEAINIAKKAAASMGLDEIFVIGGAKVYESFLPLANRMYLTYIDRDFEGDAFFPKFDLDEWKEESRENHKADGKNPYDYSFVVFTKKQAVS